MTNEYSVIYSPAARNDLFGIYRYIAFELQAGQAAENQTSRIRNEIRKLDIFPEKHQLVEWEPWASMGMRQMPVDNYVVYYLVDHEQQRVTIIRIFYGGRDVKRIIQDGIE